MSEEPLFAMEPRELTIGQRVSVQTMWGDEGGTVRSISHYNPKAWPLVSVIMDTGDTITIDVARVQPA